MLSIFFLSELRALVFFKIPVNFICGQIYWQNIPHNSLFFSFFFKIFFLIIVFYHFNICRIYSDVSSFILDILCLFSLSFVF